MMPSHLIDSSILGDQYGTEEMRRIFNDENRVRNWLLVEDLLDLESMLNEFYEFREWDENGLPDVNKVEDLDILEEYKKVVAGR